MSMLCTSAEQWAAFVTQAYYASMVSGSETPHVYTHRLYHSSEILDIGVTLREMMGGEAIVVEKVEKGKESVQGSGLRCFVCKQKGHKASQCPDRRNLTVTQNELT